MLVLKLIIVCKVCNDRLRSQNNYLCRLNLGRKSRPKTREGTLYKKMFLTVAHFNIILGVWEFSIFKAQRSKDHTINDQLELFKLNVEIKAKLLNDITF